jgi:hypothetical protein
MKCLHGFARSTLHFCNEAAAGEGIDAQTRKLESDVSLFAVCLDVYPRNE